MNLVATTSRTRVRIRLESSATRSAIGTHSKANNMFRFVIILPNMGIFRRAETRDKGLLLQKRKSCFLKHMIEFDGATVESERKRQQKFTPF